MRVILVFLFSIVAFFALFLGVPTSLGFLQNKFESTFAGCEEVTLRDSVRDQSLMLSVRSTGIEKTDTLVADWIAEYAEDIAGIAEKSSDLLVYVHGLNTETEDALCAGRALWAELDRGTTMTEPGLIVFDWPSVFGADFGAAQDMVDVVAIYLKSVLEELPPERTLVVAHSLGAQVVLSAARGLVGEPRKGLLLIQGAVPAASILSYSGSRKTHSPKGFETPGLRRCDHPEALIESIEGRARFAPSIKNFARLIITQTDRDRVLRGIFTTDELIAPRDFGIPLMMPDLRKGPRKQPTLLPIGAVWSVPFRHYSDSDVLDEVDRVLDQMEDTEEDFLLRMPQQTIDLAICTSVTFSLDHADAILLEVGNYRRDWKPVNWHSPHFHEGMRAAMIDALTGRPEG